MAIEYTSIQLQSDQQVARITSTALGPPLFLVQCGHLCRIPRLIKGAHTHCCVCASKARQDAFCSLCQHSQKAP